jgi:hypothetical protein
MSATVSGTQSSVSSWTGARRALLPLSDTFADGARENALKSGLDSILIAILGPCRLQLHDRSEIIWTDSDIAQIQENLRGRHRSRRRPRGPDQLAAALAHNNLPTRPWFWPATRLTR